MRSTLTTGIALTLAGLSMLTAVPAQDGPALQERVRSRIEASANGAPRDAIRNMLVADPDFAGLLSSLSRRLAEGLDRSETARDAVQQTILKTWRGRPDMFLKAHEETLRYLRSAARRNLITERAKGRRERSLGDSDPATGDGRAAADGMSPDDRAELGDMLRALEARLDAEDREALEACLTGHHSQRDVAARTGQTRYAASQSLERIEKALAEIL